ncbi:MAG TPA: caspase family protein [Methylomirabilota bacterium]
MSARFARRGLATLLVLSLLPLAALAEPTRADRPTYTVGDEWALKDATYRLARIEKDVYVYTGEGQREIRLTRDLGLTYVRRGADYVELIPAPRVSWPLEVGKWGSHSVLVRLPAGSADAWLTWRVEAREPVTAGGATPMAYRIRYSLGAERPGLGAGANSPRLQSDLARQITFDVTLWYAPDVQRFVKATSSKDLLTFEAAGSGTAIAQTPPPAAPPTPAPAPTTPAPPATTKPAPPAPSVAAKPTAPATPPPSAAAPPPSVAAPATPPSATAPLAVSISSPSDQVRVDRETVPLAGVVTSGRGVKQIVVTVNGAEVSRVDERAPRPAVSLNTSVKLREGPNLVVVEATGADGAIRQEVRTVFYDKPSPLEISVRYPADGARMTEEQTVVTAVVSSSRGVGSVTVTLNGTEVLRQAEPSTPRSMVVTAPVTLREGTNTIILTAREPDGTTRQEVRTVTRERSATASAKKPVPPPEPPREFWAVVIGVGRYENAGIPFLKYSVPDADAMYQVLTTTVGIKKDNVMLLTDRTERKPTLRNIKYALGTFLARSARKDDTVLVYFAGHGAPEVDPRGIERDGLAKYLIPADADPDDLYSTGLPMDELQTIFGRIEAERVVMFLDACYSGGAGGRTFASKKTRAGAVDDLFLERLTRATGRVIVTASKTSEVSLELPELGHGIFTYYLTEGLKGAADLNRDGIVSLQELYEYVEQQVSRKSRSVGGNQHPVMKGEQEGVLPLTKVRTR